MKPDRPRLPRPKIPVDVADPSGDARRIHAAAMAKAGLDVDPRSKPPARNEDQKP